jgi:ATP-dependent helicase HrpB
MQKKTEKIQIGKTPAFLGDEALLISILAGYPDRVARRRSMKSDQAELLMSGGGGAMLSPSSVVRSNEFMVAVDAEERQDFNKRTSAVIRLASAIEPEWLIDLFAGQLTETLDARWNAQAERVEVVQRLLYDQLVIDESRAGQKTGPEVSRVLANAALDAGLQRFVDPDEVARFIARVSFIAETFPEAAIKEFNDEDVRGALIKLCEGLRSFAELKNAAAKGGLIEALRGRFNPGQSRLIAQMAPEFTSIAGRRQVKINYEHGRPPWIASRLQDFFGMTDGPKIAGGRVPLVLQLLAPNQRPVQVTTDLAGFWQRIYPTVRRELSRRYPRHQWPENPVKNRQD